jgi:hypothetical protein
MRGSSASGSHMSLMADSQPVVPDDAHPVPARRSLRVVGDGELVVIFGPPAVGKMTVGRAVCERSDFRLFLNHDTIEPLIKVFGFGTAAFRTLNSEFRHRIVEEAAASGTPLIFTLVWDLQEPESARWVEGLIVPYAAAGLPVSFVELVADLGTRLVRNVGEDRLLAKPTKRDLAWSEAHLHESEVDVMNTDPAVPTPADDVLGRHRHVRVDNHGPDPGVAADRILTWLAGN